MKVIITTLTVLLAFEVCAQIDNIWDSLRTIENDSYVLEMPYKWRLMETMPGVGPEQYFEASGLAFPANYNNRPLILTIFLARQKGENLIEIKDDCMKGYRINPDRVFQANLPDTTSNLKLSSGQDAYITKTRFYRKSKDLNQSRFDLIVYSEKEKIGFLYSISVQYSDHDYSFDKENDLDGFAKKLFSYFKLK